MKLTDRLIKIASLVTKGKRVADIGTDHGYIPVYLLNKGTIPFAILADVNKGPLENARKEVRHNALLDKVDLRLGSGIEVLQKYEVDEIIIAGMGGILISELLESKLEVAYSVDRLILQPMQAQDELRKYLLNNGFEILDEVLVKE
ncbi:MAG: class I SAM-dependent methyltransferase, partial [Peptostreptococcaceae bacterium]